MAPVTLHDSDIADLVMATRIPGEDKFEDLASRLTDYEVMGYLMTRDREIQENGNKWEGNLLVDHSFSAQMVGLHQVIEPDIPNLFEQYTVPWRHTNWNASYERREWLMSSGKSKLFDLWKGKRAAARISGAELFEDQFWSAPSSSSNKLDVYGIWYWVIKATSGAGFNGQNPSGWSACAGLDASASRNARWRNYSAVYANVTRPDLIRKMRTGYRATKFKSPVTIDDYRKGKGANHRIYLNETSIDLFEEFMENRNDNHGSDITKFMDATSFKKSPLRYVPQLDSDSDNPILMLDMSHVHVKFLKGDVMHEHDPMNSQHQPNTFVEHTDTTWNVGISNRRVQAVYNQV